MLLLCAALISFNFLIYWGFSPFKRKKQLAESLKSDLKTTHTLYVVIVEELGHTLSLLSVILDCLVLGACEGSVLGGV